MIEKTGEEGKGRDGNTVHREEEWLKRHRRGAESEEEAQRNEPRGLYSRGEPVFRISDDSSFATTQRQVHFLAWSGRAHLNLNYPLPRSRASVTLRRVPPYSPSLSLSHAFSFSPVGLTHFLRSPLRHQRRVHLSGAHAGEMVASAS